MERLTDLPEIIFSSSDSRISRQLSKLQKQGVIKKLAPKIYTSNLKDRSEEIVRRNYLFIIGSLYPNALLSHRSAFEIQPTEGNNLYITYRYTKNVSLPGLELRFLKGKGPTPLDNPLQRELYLSSLERACLENLQQTRKNQSGEKKTVEKRLVEEKLVNLVKLEGEAALNSFRDRARMISEILSLQKEFEKLSKLISAILSTKPSRLLSSPQAVALSIGQPYDSFRIELFWKLFTQLKAASYPTRKEKYDSPKAFANFAFFEAFFSNYIEGTEFTVDEAKEIIFKNRVIENRFGDTHDIKGTFEVVGNKREMSKVPKTPEALSEMLKRRHAIILGGRPDKRPGKYKTKANRAGKTVFVPPNLVNGTLIKAFDPYRALEHPLARALYMMFIISEIHPFEDGNGRIARIMMNAELVSSGYRRIIIPTVFREDYLLALRKLSRQQVPDTYIKMMNIAYNFSYSLNPENWDSLLAQIEITSAFLEPSEGQLTF